MERSLGRVVASGIWCWAGPLRGGARGQMHRGPAICRGPGRVRLGFGLGLGLDGGLSKALLADADKQEKVITRF